MKTWQRRFGLVAGSVVVLAVALIGGVYGMSASALGPNHAATSHLFDASIGDAVEGERLGVMYGCTDCHTPDLGGQLLIDGMPFARVPASNLTSGAPAGAMTVEEFERAMRHGVGRDGRKLFVMPSAEYTYLSDQDIADLFAWISSLPAVERELPKRTFGPVGRTLVALGKVPFQPDLIDADANARHFVRPDASDPVQLGYYYTRLCTGCHGQDLGGAPPLEPGKPAGPNLTPAGNLASWSFDDFRTFFATGRTPDGREIDPTNMPWSVIGTARPNEIEAIWAYVRTVPPVDRPVAQ